MWTRRGKNALVEVGLWLPQGFWEVWEVRLFKIVETILGYSTKTLGRLDGFLAFQRKRFVPKRTVT